MRSEQEEEKEKLLQECLILLKKIGRHRYSIKLLLSAKHALETIANYKPPRKIKREKKSDSLTLSIPEKPKRS